MVEIKSFNDILALMPVFEQWVMNGTKEQKKIVLEILKETLELLSKTNIKVIKNED